MWDKLIERISTTEDLNRLLDGFENMEDNFYKTNSISVGDAVNRFFDEKEAEIVNEYLPQSQEKRIEIVREIKNKLRDLPLVKIISAGAVSNVLAGRICRDLRGYLNAEVVLEITLDEKIGGGAVVMYEGKYWDGSLASRMDRVWKENEIKYRRLVYGSNSN